MDRFARFLPSAISPLIGWSALVCTAFAACTGVSLGPNDGAPMATTNAQRRAGIALAAAPKVALGEGDGQVQVQSDIYVIAPLGSEKGQNVASYLSSWGSHTIFAEQTAEYGVAGMSVSGVLSSTYAWPSTSFDGGSFVSGVTASNVEAAIAEALTAAPNVVITPNTMFVVVVPDGVSVSLMGDASYDACDAGVLSWHAATRLADPCITVPYVALGACGGRLGLSEDDTLGMALSHALLNAITNPLGRGYHGVEGEASAWQALPGIQEAASLCSFAMAKSPHVIVRVDGVPWVVHRSWSNTQSLSGQPPCLPAQDDDYTVALPQDTVLVPVSLPSSATGIDLPGIPLPAGQTTTANVRLEGAGVDGNVIHLVAEAMDTNELQIDVSPSSVVPGGQAQLTLALSKQASQARYLVRLTSGRHGAAFSQYLLVKRTP